MSLFIICLSYFIGCISTIGILICLYIRYGLYSSETIIEQEQFQTFHPISENDQSKNSTLDTINYLFQFLFQELKDTAKLRHYIVKKLKIEFDDIKETQLGKIFVQDIFIQSFSMGKQCPIFSDLKLERQERDDRQLIKEVVAKLNLDYKDGFSMTLDIKLLFGYKCQLFIKIKRIQGCLRLVFRREPFSHWLVVFQDEPKIEFDIKAYLSSHQSAPLAHIITQHIRRIIRNKQTWPSYKIRYQPFFPSTKHPLLTEILCSNDVEKYIPGKYFISIKSCDRFSIPFDVINKDQYPLIISIDINEQKCEEFLCFNRNQWIKKEFIFRPKLNQINIKEMNYINRTEFLIERLDLIPNEIDDEEAFTIALRDRNIFLIQINDIEIKTLKQINSFIRGNYEQIRIMIGMPLLSSVQVPRTVEFVNTIRQQEFEQSTNLEEQTSNLIKTKNFSIDKITLLMINDDLLPHAQVKRPSELQETEYPEFDDYEFNFQVGSNERFLNVCLWCEPRLDFDVSNNDKKRVLLGYASASLAQIAFDIKMSFHRETEIALNFQSIYPDDQINFENKIAELRKHKGYDNNMTHGFVTIKIRHEPEIEMKYKQELLNSFETSINIRDDENELSVLSKSTDHIFEDQHFSEGGSCAYCGKKIWITTGRKCRNCLITVHKKCDIKLNHESICTHEPMTHRKSTTTDDEKPLLSIDENNSPIIKYDSPKRKSRKKNVNQTSKLQPSELSNNDKLGNSRQNQHNRSSRIVSVASSAYSKLRVHKPKQSSLQLKKMKLQSDSTYENIPESDLQDIITRCLSHENIDAKSLEDLFHEKAIDHTAIYAKGNEFGAELFADLTPKERKQKLYNESFVLNQIFRLQQDIDLQNGIRDDLIVEYNTNLIDENVKRTIQVKLDNMAEKIQALHALALFYCSSLKYCCSEIEDKDDNSKILDDSE